MEQLLERVCARDDAALAELYRRAYRLMFGTALRVLADPAQSEEVVQEVFLQLLVARNRYDRSRCSARAWLVTVTRRRAVDRVRSVEAARARDRLAMQRASRQVEPDPAEAVVDRLAAQQVLRGVRAALAGLPEGHREVLELAYLAGVSHQDLARRMKVPVGTIKSRIRRAVGALREATPDSLDS